MYTPPSSNSLGLHLRILYEAFQIFGFSHINFNSITCRVQFSSTRFKISRTIFHVLRIISGVILSVYVFFCLFLYLSLSRSFNIWKSIEVQENFLRIVSILSGFLNIVMFVNNYLSLDHIVVPVVNEMFQIFEVIASKTDSSVPFLSTFRTPLFFKILISSIHAWSKIRSKLVFGLSLVHPYGQVLTLLTYFAHVYSQLVLICFYMKMNKFLQVAGSKMSKPELTGHVRELLAMSFRICRIKNSLTIFFSTLNLSIYFGLFSDIFRLYQILKIILYHKFIEGRGESIREVLLLFALNIPVTLTASTDIYLIGRLSDMLSQLERIFERRMLLLVCRDKLVNRKSLNWQIDQLMVRSSVFHLSSRFIKIDPRFFFDFIINIVFIYVINCLQFYASEMIYSAANLDAKDVKFDYF